MKKTLSLVVLVVFFAVFAKMAYAGPGSFLFGVLVGSAFSSSDNETKGGGGSEEYLSPNITRVINPLNVKTISIGVDLGAKPDNHSSFIYVGAGKTFAELFAYAFKGTKENPNHFEILRIAKVVKPDSTYAVFWFSYIEKMQLSVIPPQKSK